MIAYSQSLMTRAKKKAGKTLAHLGAGGRGEGGGDGTRDAREASKNLCHLITEYFK